MSLISAAIVSALPVSELRGGIPLAIASGASPLTAFIIGVLANIAIIIPVFLFLDYLHGKFMKIRFYREKFRNYIEKSRVKLEKHIGSKWEFLFIMLFTAIPLPATGAYTATILSWYFNLNRVKAFFAISLGVIIAGALITFVSIGFLSLF